MRKIVLFLLLIVNSKFLSAQNSDEWFHQKKTQIKYLLQQIAANEVYIQYLQKGYKIAENGLQTINSIKHGDFNLHHDFFNSLKNVNPKIKNLANVTGIIALQLQIIKQAKSAVLHVQSSTQFTADEITYLQHVFNHLLDECAKDINDLSMVITSGNAQMTDDERINRINAIYTDMQDKFSFSKSFSFEAAMLAMQRSQEATDVEVSKRLNLPPTP